MTIKKAQISQLRFNYPLPFKAGNKSASQQVDHIKLRKLQFQSLVNNKSSSDKSPI